MSLWEQNSQVSILREAFSVTFPNPAETEAVSLPFPPADESDSISHIGSVLAVACGQIGAHSAVQSAAELLQDI
jgi:hypothetical protein